MGFARSYGGFCQEFYGDLFMVMFIARNMTWGYIFGAFLGNLEDIMGCILKLAILRHNFGTRTKKKGLDTDMSSLGEATNMIKDGLSQTLLGG